VSGAVIGAVTVTLTTEIMRRVEDSAGVPGLTQMVVALLILLVLYRGPTASSAAARWTTCSAPDPLAACRAR